jgi:hypothetical protein
MRGDGTRKPALSEVEGNLPPAPLPSKSEGNLQHMATREITLPVPQTIKLTC